MLSNTRDTNWSLMYFVECQARVRRSAILHPKPGWCWSSISQGHISPELVTVHRAARAPRVSRFRCSLRVHVVPRVRRLRVSMAECVSSAWPKRLVSGSKPALKTIETSRHAYRRSWEREVYCNQAAGPVLQPFETKNPVGFNRTEFVRPPSASVHQEERGMRWRYR